jgi:serine/threonine-protein kinase
MLSFSVRFTRGEPPQDQILAAVREAFASGQLRDGDSFPSARILTQELKVSPSVAQKVVDQLVDDGFLTQTRGSGLMIRTGSPASWVSELKATQSTRLEEKSEALTVVDRSYPFLTPSETVGVEGCIGDYEVARLIARGGMGMVFEALDPGLQRKVAIKVLAPQLATSAESRSRFLREARAIAAIDHENVLPVYAVGESFEVPYLVMPLVAGESLHAKLRREGTLQLEDLLRIALAAARGLAAAHAQDLIHRDIKPDNVLLEETGDRRVWLADFGLARAAHDRDITRTGVIAGTPQFSSPEQAQGLEVDFRTDLFSFGSLLFAMATGSSPFAADNPLAVLRKIVEEEPGAIDAARSDLPEALVELVGDLLQKDPARRPPATTQLVDRLSSLGR